MPASRFRVQGHRTSLPAIDGSVVRTQRFPFIDYKRNSPANLAGLFFSIGLTLVPQQHEMVGLLSVLSATLQRNTLQLNKVAVLVL